MRRAPTRTYTASARRRAPAEVCEQREAALAEDIEREKRIKREMEELQREIDAIRRAERSSEQCVCVIA